MVVSQRNNGRNYTFLPTPSKDRSMAVPSDVHPAAVIFKIFPDLAEVSQGDIRK